MSDPRIGCTKDDLDTPALCVDLDAMESNIAVMLAACRTHGVAWRPHAKCHKSPEIARRLLGAGAEGITCAKLGEAEVMAAEGIRDILIANMIVGPIKLARLVRLCEAADPIVAVDHALQAEMLSSAMTAAGRNIRVLIEVDAGLARVGCQPGEPALRLATQARRLPGIELAGIMAYEGHLLSIEDIDEKRRAIHAALARIVDTKHLLEREGIACPTVSCGGTGSYEITVAYPGVTELQAGGAIFMDAFYRNACGVRSLQYAMTLLTTVVSRPAPERAVIDAGRKTLNKEVHMPLVRSAPSCLPRQATSNSAPGCLSERAISNSALGSDSERITGRDDITVSRLSAEHGDLHLEPSARGLQIGDRLELIPGYGDLTTVLHEVLYGFRGEKLEAVFDIAARGKVQ